MHKLLLTLHVVGAIFLVGPLVATANRAPRALRDGDATALGQLARLVTVYGWTSLLVGVFGAGLVQDRYGRSWSEGWLVASLVLFLAASALVLAVLAPQLRKATATAAGGGSTADRVGPAAAAGGVASLCYVVTAVLMVYQPG